VNYKRGTPDPGFGLHGLGVADGRQLHDFLQSVSCGRCGRVPNARYVRSVRQSCRWSGPRAGDAPVNLWQWRCRCGADWQVPKSAVKLERRIVLGVDLG